jgi:hypothetical protein
MKNKPNQKIQLDASKLVGFTKVGNSGQKTNTRLQSKVGEKVGTKIGGKVGRKPMA